MRRAVEWPGIAGSAGQEQRVSTVGDNPRTGKVLKGNCLLYSMSG